MVATIVAVIGAAAAVIALFPRRRLSAWITRHRTIEPGAWWIGGDDDDWPTRDH